MQYREIPRQSEMFRLLAQGRVDTSPLKLLAVKREPIGKARPKTRKADATIELGWGRKAFRFAVECQAVSTPKEIAAAAETAKRSSSPPRSFPMVVVPYLPESQMRLLQEQQVSGIDLSGNALIMVPDEILVSRTGSPNNFRRAGVIKNVYRKNSSIVPRVFLLKPQYDSITEVMDEIKCRGGSITQATVSKVCNSLDQDLVIERTKGQLPRTRSLRLIQPDKLLELLTENYAPPQINQRLTAKTTFTPDEFCRRLAEWRNGSRPEGGDSRVPRPPANMRSWPANRSSPSTVPTWKGSSSGSAPTLKKRLGFPTSNFWRPTRTSFTSIRVITWLHPRCRRTWS